MHLLNKGVFRVPYSSENMIPYYEYIGLRSADSIRELDFQATIKLAIQRTLKKVLTKNDHAIHFFAPL